MTGVQTCALPILQFGIVRTVSLLNLEDWPLTWHACRVEKDLGIQWRPFEQTVRETFTQLLEVERASKQQ